MRCLTIILSLLLLHGAFSTGLCPAEWILHERCCYHFKPMAALQYEGAENACISLGGHLTSINSQEEQDFFNRTVRPLAHRLWIGLNDRREESIFEWVDETPFIYNHWGHVQPDGLAGDIKHCVHILFNGTDGWYDVPCNESYGYICKKPALKQCDPPKITTGVVLGSTKTIFDVQEQLSFSCSSEQHHIVGENPLTCQNEDGKMKGVWSAAPPTCDPNTCFPPAVNIGVAIGSLTNSNTEFSIGEQVSFDCTSQDHVIYGESQLICLNIVGQANGEWNAVPPTCGVPSDIKPRFGSKEDPIVSIFVPVFLSCMVFIGIIVGGCFKLRHHNKFKKGKNWIFDKFPCLKCLKCSDPEVESPAKSDMEAATTDPLNEDKDDYTVTGDVDSEVENPKPKPDEPFKPLNEDDDNVDSHDDVPKPNPDDKSKPLLNEDDESHVEDPKSRSN